MRLEQFTVKAQEALAESQASAEKLSNPQVEPEHLLKALLEQKDGVVVPLLRKVGLDVRALQGAADAATARLSKVTGDISQTSANRSRRTCHVLSSTS